LLELINSLDGLEGERWLMTRWVTGAGGQCAQQAQQYAQQYAQAIGPRSRRRTVWVRRFGLGVAIGLVLGIWGGEASLATSRKAKPEPEPTPAIFLPNPLLQETPDPLLPQPPRPLNATERTQLVATLAVMDAEANALLAAGNAPAAFERWQRVLRLHRALGPLEEVQALGRISEIAWRETETTQVRWIAERLQVLQEEATLAQNVAQLEAIGQAYLQIRDQKLALGVYEPLLAEARQQRNFAQEQATLLTIARLYLDWLDYANAANIYQELLQSVRSYPPTAPKPELTPIAILQQLAYIYQQDRQFQAAIPVLQELITTAQAQQRLEPIPGWLVELADSHQAIAQLEAAALRYQDAYTLAIAQQQFARASDALNKLALLYQSQNQPDAALQVYQVLLDVGQRSYDYYGMMNTYDQIGQIQLLLRAYPQAIGAFQQGLALAQQLRFREDYFSQRIQSVHSGTSQGQTLPAAPPNYP